MLFNSQIFLIFFIVVYGLYRLLPHRWQNMLLLVSSYFFYGWWDWRFLSLIFLSTVIDYIAGGADLFGGAEPASPQDGGSDQHDQQSGDSRLFQVFQLFRG